MTKPDKQGRAARLRALPGFTAAAVIFCTVVLMGTGAMFAVAKWRQSAAVTMTVTAASVAFPTPAIVCTTSGNTAVITVNGVPAPPAGQHYMVNFAAADGTSLASIVTTGQLVFERDGLLAAPFNKKETLYVTVQVGLTSGPQRDSAPSSALPVTEWNKNKYLCG